MTEHRSGPVRSAAAREAVLHSTAQLFARQGWDHLTMEGIAKEAGVSKQTIYRWWPTRGALIADCMLEGRLVAVDIGVPDTGNLRLDLHTWLTPLLSLATTESGAFLIRSLVAAAAEDAVVGERLGEALGIDQTLSDRLARAVQAGELPEHMPVSEVGLSLLGVIVLPIVGRRLLDPETVLRHVDFFFGSRSDALPAPHVTSIGS